MNSFGLKTISAGLACVAMMPGTHAMSLVSRQENLFPPALPLCATPGDLKWQPRMLLASIFFLGGTFY